MTGTPTGVREAGQEIEVCRINLPDPPSIEVDHSGRIIDPKLAGCSHRSTGRSSIWRNHPKPPLKRRELIAMEAASHLSFAPVEGIKRLPVWFILPVGNTAA